MVLIAISCYGRHGQGVGGVGMPWDQAGMVVMAISCQGIEGAEDIGMP